MKEVLRTYRGAGAQAIRHWRIGLMIYAVQLVFVYLVHLPLLSWIYTMLEDSRALTRLSEQFDFNIIMDMLHEGGQALSFWFMLAMIAALLYFVVQNIFAGGIISLYKSNNGSIAAFYFTGIKQLLKNLVISTLFLASLSIILMLFYAWFSKDGLHVLDLDNEIFLIRRFWMLLALFLIISLFLGIGRDLARVGIADPGKRSYFVILRNAASGLVKPRYILLVLIDFLVLAALAFIYYVIAATPFLVDSSWIVLVLMQLLVIIRIIARMSRLGSFFLLDRS